ncbi:MAG: hypothetical protein H7318_00785 [Oligoflexus sp.]|nr:hypothetical protein [Oligoflexus sp.]
MFQVLFDPGEHSCFADNPKGTRVFPLDHYNKQRHGFFSINPLDGTRDRDPVEAYHHPLKPRRADANVTVFRNILVEMDKDTLADQLAIVNDRGMPYSSCVFSGGKSYHFILCLATPLESRAAYDDMVMRIYRVLGDRIDPSCKNPSRLSRSPDHLRADKMKFQSLKDLRERVENSVLENWLQEQGSLSGESFSKDWSKPIETAKHIGSDEMIHVPLYRTTWEFLDEGAPEGEWNLRLFKAACDVFQKGWALDDFMTKAAAITGHLDQNDQATIRSAYRRMQRGTA